MSAPDERQHPAGNCTEGGGLSPMLRSIQQQQQHEDYDWMGILDTLDDHFDLVDHDRLVYQQYHQFQHNPYNGNAASGAGDVASTTPPAAAAAASVGVDVGANHGHNHECWDSSSRSATAAVAAATGVGGGGGGGGGKHDNGMAALVVASAIAATGAAPPNHGVSEGGGMESSMSTLAESVATSAIITMAAAVADAETDNRKQSRVERKRSREKKRRFDTNFQFMALAELVKEIEATDLAEEALFDFNKQFYNHDGKEEEEEDNEQPKQQRRHEEYNDDDDEEGKSSNKNAKIHHSNASPPGGERQSKTIKSRDTNENNNNIIIKKTKSPTTLLASTSSLSTAMSNRIDLIARTIVQLNQFRMLRRRRNSELRECQRKNCELRKECEGLHRLVAQYKAMGKMMGGNHNIGEGGYARPQLLQEKVRYKKSACRCLDSSHATSIII